jgi:serine/threonine protein kinase
VLPLEGRMLDGKFSLDRKIGDGGMASVWQATNIRVARTVAIKLMHARYAGDPELLVRFRNEAAAAGKIDSDNICDVLDFGESPIGPYIVMELLDGCSLAELIHQRRKLDPGLAVWIARQALAGLAAAHRAGIVHRDLKPENIHLCRAIRGQWTIKLVDFGISKFAQDPNTAAGATLGTPHYMAPEQIQGAAKVDARADLWSMGVILYESVTGVQLFARDNVATALAALRTYDPPPLTQYLPNAPRGLAEVVARCLVRSPDKRVATADALAEALKPFERMEPRAAEAAAKVVTERKMGANPRVLAQAQVPAQAQPVQPAMRVVAAPVAAPVGRVAPVSVAPVRSASGPPQPGLADRSTLPAPARAGRLPMPGSQRTGSAAPQPASAPASKPTVAPVVLAKQSAAPRPAVKQPAAKPAAKPAVKPAATKHPATKQPAPAAVKQPSPAAKRGAKAPRRGIAATPADRAMLLGVLLALFGGIVVLAVVLAIK